MQMGRLVQTAPFEWTLPASEKDHRARVVLFGSHDLVAAMDDKVLEQASNVARLPGIVGASFAMPDAHWGYGFPIGGVAAFDPRAGGIISAGGVGFDISCGIRALRTSLTEGDVAAHARELADSLFDATPAGVGEEGGYRLSSEELDEMLLGGARWAVQSGFGAAADLEYVEEQGCMSGAVPGFVSALAKRRQAGEMGTLGSGNHYLEVQVVERIYDPVAADAFGLRTGGVVVCIHCGSRGLGHQIGTEYLLAMAKTAAAAGIVLPERDLACAPITSETGIEYLGAMRAGINCALANRQMLSHSTREAFAGIFRGAVIETLFDVSHNTCKVETHIVDGVRRELYVHRKGATRAFGPGHPDVPKRYQAVGQPVIIGGSMGTASYILAGAPESENRAFSSASHGAGRAMSRHEALKHWRGRALVDELATAGILIKTKSMRGVAEEAPGAYKDVDAVAESTELAGLARRVARLRPRICIKG